MCRMTHLHLEAADDRGRLSEVVGRREEELDGDDLALNHGRRERRELLPRWRRVLDKLGERLLVALRKVHDAVAQLRHIVVLVDDRAREPSAVDTRVVEARPRRARGLPLPLARAARLRRSWRPRPRAPETRARARAPDAARCRRATQVVRRQLEGRPTRLTRMRPTAAMRANARARERQTRPTRARAPHARTRYACSERKIFRALTPRACARALAKSERLIFRALTSQR